jgi:hypothetical protein
MEIHEWLRALGKRSYDEYKTLTQKTSTTGETIRSDMTLTVLTSNRNANYSVTFKDAFPIKLSGINFDVTSSDIDYVPASATFRYVTYDVTKVI